MKSKRWMVFLFLNIFVNSAFPEEAAFIKLQDYYLGNTDQRWIQDAYLASPELLFVLYKDFNAHSMFEGMALNGIDLRTVPKTYDEYYYSCISFAGGGIFGMIYEQGGMMLVPGEKQIREQIIPASPYLYLPNYDNESHCFTLDGTYKGLIPNPEAVNAVLTPSITMSNKQVLLPVTIREFIYKRVVSLGKTSLLIADGAYTSVGTEDLKENGKSAIFHTTNAQTGTMLFCPISEDYVLILSSSPADNRLCQIIPGEPLKDFPCNSFPMRSRYSLGSFMDVYYYQLEDEDYFCLKLVKYFINGLPGVSNVKENAYK